MSAGWTEVVAQFLQDSTGSPIARATIISSPVNDRGQPISFRAGGSGGQVLPVQVRTQVVDGAFAITLADTTLTTPVNIGYAVTIEDEYGNILWGYKCIQPSGDTWSLDTYQPDLGTLVSYSPGPPGPVGPAYSIASIGNLSGNFADAVVSGSVDGSNTVFTVSGVSGAYWLVYRNGIRQLPGRDFNQSGNQLTMAVPPNPNGLGAGNPDVIMVTAIAPQS